MLIIFMVLVIKIQGKKMIQMYQYGGFQQVFTHDPYGHGVKLQWRYTGAPDADARTIQATCW